MVVRKITIDNSVRYIPITDKTNEREIKPRTIKVGSLPRKQSKNFSQNNKKIFKHVAAKGFTYLKGIMNC